jgi:hypothetical protein
MPQFHLHIRTAGELIEDEEGIEVADCNCAIFEAVKGARCLMRGEVVGGTLCLDQSIEIHDAAGQHVTTVPFIEALRIVHDGKTASVIHTADCTRS